MKLNPFLIAGLAAFTMTAFMNCSGVNFSKDSGQSLAGDAGTGKDGNNNGSGDPNDGSNPGDATGGVVQPGGGDPNNGGIIIGGGPGGTSDVSNAGGPGTTPTGTTDTPMALAPKVQFIGPPCIRLTNCAITFKLDKAYASVVDFDWATIDNLYGTPPDPGQPAWGKAAPSNSQPCPMCYVSTSGHVSFAPGQTEQTVHVRNINSQNVEISIGVSMTNCAYNSKLETAGCQKYFAP